MSDRVAGRNELDVALELTYSILAGSIYAKIDNRREVYLDTFTEAYKTVRQCVCDADAAAGRPSRKKTAKKPSPVTGP